MQAWTGDYPAAAASLTQALGMYRDLGDRPGEACAINNLGEVQARSGDYLAAAASLTEALGMFRELGDPYGQAARPGRSSGRSTDQYDVHGSMAAGVSARMRTWLRVRSYQEPTA